MRLLELHLMAYGPFTQQVLRLGTGEQRLVLVHGPNEAGKSSALRAISGLRFGIDERSPDNFVHAHPQLRIGGVFADAQGHTHALVRRKGRGNTLRLASLSPLDASLQEQAEPVPPALQALLTAGLSAADYQTMFGIDHAALRRGGQALARGDGEIGAALFEASSGTANIGQLLGQLDESARQLFLAGANAKRAKINLALGTYKEQQEEHRRLQVRPSHWQKLDAEAREAQATLARAEGALQALQARHLLVKELLGVGPALAELAQAEAVVQALADVRLLAEDTANAHAQATAGLSEAQADALSATEAARSAQAGADAIAPDAALLQAGTAIAQLHAAVPVIAALQSELAGAEAEQARCLQAWRAAASEIDRHQDATALQAQVPTATARAALQAAAAALAATEDKLALHQQAAQDEADTAEALPPEPDAAAQATLRVVLAEVARADDQLQRLARLPAELARAQRAATSACTALGLADANSVRQITPIMGVQVDEAVAANASLAQQRSALHTRLQAIAAELGQHHAEVSRLLAHGAVPTRQDVAEARVRRDQTWILLRKTAATGAADDRPAQGSHQSLQQSFESALTQADQLVDTLLRDYERVTALELAKARLAELQGSQQAAQDQAQAQEAEAEQALRHWQARLQQAGIPAMPPTQLRDWQARCASLLAQLDALGDLQAEQLALHSRQQQLGARLRAAIQRLAPLPMAEDEALSTLVAIAEDKLREQDALSDARHQAAGRTAQRQRQQAEHSRRQSALLAELATARTRLDALAPQLLLPAGALPAVVRSRLAEFEALQQAGQAQDEAQHRLATQQRLLASHQAQAAAVAATLGEALPLQLTLAAGQWATRLASAQANAQARDQALAQAQSTRQQADEHQAKAQRHRATLERLVHEAGVAGIDALPEALHKAQCKRQAAQDLAKAQARLQQSSSRPRAELNALLAHHDSGALRAEEAALAGQLQAASTAVASARTAEEAARHALAAIDASGEAAAAADAAARAAATVRQALPLWMRNRLAHALLKEAVRRFKERTQAPMLVAASGYFAQITGGEFAGLHSDDSEARPVILARRPGGALVAMDGLSEGTQDQLYLALRLAALDLQRASGADLPLVLDDVLMTSDDTRAACMLRALSAFAVGGQVIVFTHHAHLCDIARAQVPDDQLAIVDLQRGPRG